DAIFAGRKLQSSIAADVHIVNAAMDDWSFRPAKIASAADSFSLSFGCACSRGVRPRCSGFHKQTARADHSPKRKSRDTQSENAFVGMSSERGRQKAEPYY